jgi:hypothetical protein
MEAKKADASRLRNEMCRYYDLLVHLRYRLKNSQ